MCRPTTGRMRPVAGRRVRRPERQRRLDALRDCASVIERSQALAALSQDEFDVVVVGGGITGAGVALDAATRGYSVALLERADYASGTSSRSSKLVHGGLRYLQNFDLGLVREALLERQLMVALAPHLVRPLPLVVPAFDGAHPDRLVGVGLNLYDVMSVDRDRLRSRRAKRGRAERAQSSAHRCAARGQRVLEPRAPPRDLRRGGARAAARAGGARADQRLPVLRLPDRRRAPRADRARRGRALRRGLRQPRSTSPGCSSATVARTACRCSTARAASASRCAPPTSSTRPACGPTSCAREELHEEAELPRIRPSRGTHMTIRHEDLPLVGGAIVPAGGGRTIFALPWLGHTLVGTTDNDYEGPLEHISPPTEDVDYLLDAVNEFFGTELGAGQLTGAFAGVRPLISTGDPKKSVDISRKAELYETSSGMITITGGKLTTWRRMAKMTVDRLVERDARDAPCRTHEIPLGQAIAVEELPRVEGVPEELLRRRSPRATATPRARCSRWPAERQASSPSRSSRACPTCSPRSRSRPAASRRAASATCCCGAPASGCWRRAS